MTKSEAQSPSENSGTLARVERWFRSNCNEDWEHTYGIVLETVDNPGWMLTVDLRDTPLFDRPFPTISQGTDDSD